MGHSTCSSSRCSRPELIRAVRDRSRAPGARLLAVIAAVLIGPTSTWAIDTIEPFEKGASDVEVYLGGDWTDRSDEKSQLGLSFQIGYGLTESLSLYLTGSATSNTLLRDAERGLGLGVFGTVLDTRYVDLDLILDFSLSGAELGDAAVAPGLELNIDLDRFGLFLTAFEAVSGRDSPGGGDGERVFDTELSLGGLWNVADGHQLLVAWMPTVHHTPESGQDTFEVGGLGLGYNVMLHESIELINELVLRIPPAGEALGIGLSTGLVVTL